MNSPERAWIHYGRYLNERLQGKPTQYITHRQEFYGREFYVNGGRADSPPRNRAPGRSSPAIPRHPNRTQRCWTSAPAPGAIAITLVARSRAPRVSPPISRPMRLTVAAAQRRALSRRPCQLLCRRSAGGCASGAASTCWCRIRPTCPVRMRPTCSPKCAIGNRTSPCLPATADSKSIGA